MIIDGDELRRELEVSHKHGRMTERFALLAITIANAHLHRRYGGSNSDIEEYMCSFHLAIVRGWHRINPEGNISSYICRMAENRAKNVMRSMSRRKARNLEWLEIIEEFGKNIQIFVA